jgi:hypothetical protein
MRACAQLTGWPLTPQSDAHARDVLAAAAALAQRCACLPGLAPQPLHIPPWLPSQPGRARGLLAVQAGDVDPPLLLDTAQLQLLKYGGLSGERCS